MSNEGTPRLLPVVDAIAAPFFEAAERGELVVQRCPETGRLVFPPRERSPFAPHCTPEWQRVSGRGAIWSVAVPHPPLMAQFADLGPYAVIVVALDEDPSIRLVGNLVTGPDGAIDEIDPATVEIGARVRVVFAPQPEGPTLPRWVLAPGDGGGLLQAN